MFRAGKILLYSIVSTTVLIFICMNCDFIVEMLNDAQTGNEILDALEFLDSYDFVIANHTETAEV